MAGRHIEKYPIVWIGELAIKHTKTTVKLTYVSGDMRIAMNALPKVDPIPSITLDMRLRSNMHDDYSYQKSKCCILTAQPYGETDEELMKNANALNSDVVEYLRGKEATGAAAYSDEGPEEYKIHLYLKSESASSILAPLAPDWFHLLCERMYFVVLIFE